MVTSGINQPDAILITICQYMAGIGSVINPYCITPEIWHDLPQRKRNDEVINIPHETV